MGQRSTIKLRLLDQVTCVGQVIGAVVAKTQAQAQRAAKMVKISYEELPRILTIEVIKYVHFFLEIMLIHVCINLLSFMVFSSISGHVIVSQRTVSL